MRMDELKSYDGRIETRKLKRHFVMTFVEALLELD